LAAVNEQANLHSQGRNSVEEVVDDGRLPKDSSS